MKTICPYCGCGCSYFFEVKNKKVIIIKPYNNYPVINGKPCINVLSSYQTIYADRIKKPMIRKDKKLKEVNWKEAYEFIYKNTKNLKPNEIAFLASSPATNEDCYLFQKFARDVFKTNNIDSCARICHASTCYAFQKAFGITGMPSRIGDFEKADCILITGSNPKATYPVAFDKMLKSKAKLICVRDWKDETSKHADLYVEILDGTELAFLNAVLNILIKKVPKEMKNFLKKYTTKKVSRICKTEEKNIEKAARLIEKSKKFVLCYGMGLTQHSYGVENVYAAINLVLAKKGKIIPMRGKTNIQGVGDMGCLPSKGGDTISSSVFVDPVKALYVMETNPAQSLPDLNKVHKAFKKMFIVLQTSYPNVTMEFADVVLPCCSWAERSGTFTSAESRIRFLNKAIDPLYDSKPNLVILKELARYYGKNYDYQDVVDILKEIKKNVEGYKKINIKKLIKGGSEFVFRPVKFKRFNVAEFKGVEEETTKKYPFVLTTERTPYHFCTGEMSRRSKTLNKLLPEARCLISVEDAKRLKLENNDLIKISSKVGSIKIKVMVNDDVPKNLLIVPFHFREALVNKLIPLKYSPLVEEPNLKKAAVNVQKI